MVPVRAVRPACLVAGVGLSLLAVTTGTASAAPADGRTVYGVTSGGNRLVSFPAGNPAAATPVTNGNGGAIAGLGAGERVVGTDFRPANNLMYALTLSNVSGSGNTQTGTGRVYTVDKSTAVATFVYQLTVNLSGAYFDIGFNPVANALRIVSSNGQNLRVPTAALAAGGAGVATVTDTALAYVTGDPNASSTKTRIAAADYTTATPSGTTLYDVDYGNDTLALQGSVNGTPTSPNTGALSSIGTTGLGSDVTNLLGFDIETDGTAYMSAQVVDPDTLGNSSSSVLYTVDLTTGKATRIGDVAGDLLDSITIDTTPAAVTPPAALPEFSTAALAPVSALALLFGITAFRRRRTA